MNITDPQYRKEISAIMADTTLTTARKRVAAGKATRAASERLKNEGKSNAEIADLLGLPEERIVKALAIRKPENN